MLASRGIGEKIVKRVGKKLLSFFYFLVVLMKKIIFPQVDLLSVSKNVVEHWWPEETVKDLEKDNDRP